MIPASVDRAIVEVFTPAGASEGTGFLVSGDGLILTARHVGGGSQQVEVRFLGYKRVVATLVEEGPSGEDWALYRAAEVPAGIEPIPQGKLGNVADAVFWYSIGHAKLRNGLRGAFHGEVRSTVPVLDLFCRELADDKFYEDARGLSGGPCIVDGEVIALIVNVLCRGDNNLIVTGQVLALPLEKIRPQKVQLALCGESRLPWEHVITSALQGLSPDDRLIAASTARLANPVEGDRLPRQIARRMINQGILMIAEVLLQLRAKLDKNLEVKVSEQILEMAETLWVSGRAAECLAGLVQDKQLGVLATDCGWSAQHHLRRAYATRELGAVAWKHAVVDAGAHKEPFADAVVAKAYEVLGKLLLSKDPATIKRRVATFPFVTAFVVSVPRKDVVDKLRAEFPKLVIVFMSRHERSTAVPNPFVDSIEQVLPAPSAEEERQAKELNGDASALLGVSRS